MDLVRFRIFLGRFVFLVSYDFARRITDDLDDVLDLDELLFLYGDIDDFRERSGDFFLFDFFLLILVD